MVAECNAVFFFRHGGHPVASCQHAAFVTLLNSESAVFAFIFNLSISAGFPFQLFKFQSLLCATVRARYKKITLVCQFEFCIDGAGAFFGWCGRDVYFAARPKRTRPGLSKAE